MTETEPTPAGRPIDSTFRFIGQLVGLILVVVGAYFLVSLAGLVVGYVHDPKQMNDAVTATAETIGADKLAWTFNGDRIDAGRPVAAAAYAFFCLIAVWIVGAFVSVGARLLFGQMDEKRQLYAAVKEMAMLARTQDAAKSKA